MYSSQDTIKRLPLATQPENRNNTTQKDGKLINAYIEKQQDGEYAVIKRPGIATSPTGTTAVDASSGLFNWNGNFYSVVGTGFYQNSTLIGAVDGTAGKQYFMTTILGATPKLVLSNGVKSYSYDSGAGLVLLTPTGFVPGWAYLDGTLYYVNSMAQVFGSGINDLATWNPLNVIVAQSDPANAVAISKQLVYVIVFKAYTTEVFYDNANPAGSPLSPNLGATKTYGCKSAYTIRDIDGALFWVATSRAGSNQIVMMRDLAVQVVSTPWIEKLINLSNFNTVYSWSYKGEGHSFYIVTLVDINLTLAYDIRENTWSQWTDQNGNYMPISGSTSYNSVVIVQHAFNGNIYQMSGVYTNDYGTLIPVDIYTPPFDGGVGKKKLINLMKFNSDQTQGSILQVNSNDYDYDPARWTNPRIVDLGAQKPMLTNCGSFYRRAYHFHHATDYPLRITSIDIDVDIGTL